MCGATIWLPSHHPGGCCTLVVVEEIPPSMKSALSTLKKHYVNVINYYYTIPGLVGQLDKGSKLERRRNAEKKNASHWLIIFSPFLRMLPRISNFGILTQPPQCVCLPVSEFCLSCGKMRVATFHPLFEGGLCLTCKVRVDLVLHILKTEHSTTRESGNMVLQHVLT